MREGCASTLKKVKPRVFFSLEKGERKSKEWGARNRLGQKSAIGKDQTTKVTKISRLSTCEKVSAKPKKNS